MTHLPLYQLFMRCSCGRDCGVPEGWVADPNNPYRYVRLADGLERSIKPAAKKKDEPLPIMLVLIVGVVIAFAINLRFETSPPPPATGNSSSIVGLSRVLT